MLWQVRLSLAQHLSPRGMQEGQDVWAKTQRPRSLGDCTIGTLDYSESKVSVRTKGEFGDALSRPTSEQGPGDIST